MSQQFSFDSKYKKGIGMLGIAGVILIVLGLALSNVKSGHGGHGDAHGAGHGGDSTQHAAPAAGHGSDSHSGHGSDSLAAGEDHGTAADSAHVSDSAAAVTATAAHDGGHDAGHHEAAGADAHSGLKTWHDVQPEAEHAKIMRAPIHPGQEVLAVHASHEPEFLNKLGASWFIGTIFWLGVAVFGVFFIAVGYMANAGWYVAIKRVLETYYMYILVGLGGMLVVFLLKDYIYTHWSRPEEELDFILQKKKSFLNWKWLLGTILIFCSGWFFFGMRFRKYSLSEDQLGGLENHKKSIRNAAMFLPFFGVSFCLAGFLWLMSLEPHWYSTIYAVNVFAGIFVGGLATTILITTNLKERGYLPEVSAEHIHDLGKFMFAISIFWAYTWVSQLLLIWYANIPEEVAYYADRFENYKGLFFINIGINFLFPFLALMTRNAKREFSSVRTVAAVILLGRFVDLFMLVMPGALGAHWNMGVLCMALGFFLLMGAVFFYFVFSGLTKASLSAKNHPYYEESVHHETGV